MPVFSETDEMSLTIKHTGELVLNAIHTVTKDTSVKGPFGGGNVIQSSAQVQESFTSSFYFDPNQFCNNPFADSNGVKTYVLSITDYGTLVLELDITADIRTKPKFCGPFQDRQCGTEEYTYLLAKHLSCGQSPKTSIDIGASVDSTQGVFLENTVNFYDSRKVLDNNYYTANYQSDGILLIKQKGITKNIWESVVKVLTSYEYIGCYKDKFNDRAMVRYVGDFVSFDACANYASVNNFDYFATQFYNGKGGFLLLLY